jgi:hypothetical protein
MVLAFRADLARVSSQLVLVVSRVTADGRGSLGQAVVALRTQVGKGVGHHLARGAVVACNRYTTHHTYDNDQRQKLVSFQR